MRFRPIDCGAVPDKTVRNGQQPGFCLQAASENAGVGKPNVDRATNADVSDRNNAAVQRAIKVDYRDTGFGGNHWRAQGQGPPQLAGDTCYISREYSHRRGGNRTLVDFLNHNLTSGQLVLMGNT